MVGFQNNTGATISGLTLAFDYERYRINTAAAAITFFYSTDGSTWTAVTGGDSGAFSTGASAYEWPHTTVSKTGVQITGLSIPNGGYIYLRWHFNTTGSNSQGLGLDNFSLTATLGSGGAGKMFVTLPGQTFISGTGNSGTPSDQTTGTPFNITLTATLSDGLTIDTGYSGTKTISYSGPGGSPVYTTSVTFTGGQATGVPVTLVVAETATIAATDGTLTGEASSSVTINPAQYRSKTSGNWNTAGTWEKSDDNGANWVEATVTPTSGDGAISIRNGHTVTVTAGVTVDQVTVDSGGQITLNSSVTLTVANGAGDDMVVQNGGVFVLNANPSFSSSATARIDGGGILRVAATGLTSSGSAVHSGSVVYQNGSILEYTPTTAFSASGITYFPNVDGNTVPVFRVTALTSGNTVGGSSATVVNGVLEVGSSASVSWTGTGTKTFRNGIRGGGNVNQGSAGQFFISGATAELGGSGTLTLGANGLQINSASVVILSSDKTVDTSIGAFTVAGTLNLTGKTLTGSATVSSGGTLKGNGTVTGTVVVQSGGTLSPGASIGTLTFASAPSLGGITLMEIDRGASPNADKLVLSSGTLTYGGTLTVTATGGALDIGDTFDLFDAGAFAGSFTTLNLPVLTKGYWNTSQSSVDGTITVACEPQITAPPGNQTVCSGSSANFSVTATGAESYQWRKRGAGWGSSGGWTLNTVSGSGSFYVGSSTDNNAGGPTSNGGKDINTSGKAWGIYNENGVSEASRNFSPLAVGQTFSIDMDNGGINGTVGFGLQNSSGENRLEFYFVGGHGNYTLNDGTPQNTGIAFTRQGVNVRVRLTGTDSYSATITRYIDNATATFTGTLGGTAGSGISRARLFNANGGGGADHNLYFNNLVAGAYDDDASAYASWSNGDNKGQGALSGGNISGANSSSLSISSVTASDAGDYDVVIANSCGQTTSSAATLTVNQTPVAAADGFTRNQGASLKISLGSLIANDSDSDDTFGITAVDATTAGGKTLSLNGPLSSSSTLILVPDTVAHGDTFTYTITDARGCAATGTVTISVNTVVTGQATITLTDGGAGLAFWGMPGWEYIVQRATTLSGGGDWADLSGTLTADAYGRISYTDPSPPGGGAYYRLRAAP